MGNSTLKNAKQAKNDEFYTQLSDIENELKHYTDHFRGKVVFCNCDDPEWSNFYKYFELNFKKLGLKKLITTHFDASKPTYKLVIIQNTGDGPVRTGLEQNGDFRSPECMSLLEEADIVVTNPPFSLFREFVAMLMEHEKKFVIVGSLNAVTYKEIFSLIQQNKLWLGHGFRGGNAYFSTPTKREFADGVYDEKSGLVKFRNVAWFTNLPHAKRDEEELILHRTYAGHEAAYPKYDNFDAIEVSKIADIPKDYFGSMGVPITFLANYNPAQFEILGNLGSYAPDGYSLSGAIYINGRKIFKRIVIKRKSQTN